MNVYSLLGDALHLLSIIVLITKLIKNKSCGGVSGKTQLIFVVAYSTRYLDLFTDVYFPIYNSIFKITLIVCYFIILLLIFGIHRKSYRSNEDTFFTELLLIPCFLLSVWVNHGMTPIEILWSFSIYLETVAILPQFYMIFKRREIEASLIHYLTPMGIYKLMYISNWFYRYDSEHFYDAIAEPAGVVYVAIYVSALVTFCVMRISVTDEDNRKFLKKNIFFVSGNEEYSKIENEEKSVADSVITA